MNSGFSAYFSRYQRFSNLSTTQIFRDRWKNGDIAKNFGLRFSGYLYKKYRSSDLEKCCGKCAKWLGMPKGQRSWESLYRLAENTEDSSPKTFRTLHAAAAKKGLSSAELDRMGLTEAWAALHQDYLAAATRGYRVLASSLAEELVKRKDLLVTARKLFLLVLNGDYFRNARLFLQKRDKLVRRLPSEVNFQESEPAASERIDEELKGPQVFTKLHELEIIMPTREHYDAWLKLSDRVGRYEGYPAARKFWRGFLKELQVAGVSISLYESPLIPEFCYFIDYGHRNGLVLGTHILFGTDRDEWPSYEASAAGIGQGRLDALMMAFRKLAREEWRQTI